MNRCQRLATAFAAAILLVAGASAAWAEGNGQADFDEALRVKATAEGLKDLYKVIDLLESALDKGLDLENSDFAEQMLSAALLERASNLAMYLESVPEDGLPDPRMQRIREMAVSDLRRVLTYDAPPAQASMMLAKLLALPGGDGDEARELLNELVDGESFAALPAGDQADVLALRATLQKDDETALADFNRAIELAPADADHLLSRAQYLFEHEQTDAALADVANVIAGTPDQAGAYLLQAQILRVLKRFDDAIASLQKVTELAPDSPVPYLYRGEIYREQENYDAAIAELTRVLQLEPRLDLALIRRAEAYFLSGKLDEALADVDAVLKDNPGMALAHALRAQVLAGKERLGDAIAEMKLLADELPGQPDIRLFLAQYLMLNDQPQEAIDAYSDVIAMDGAHHKAIMGRGDAYLSIGDHAPAIADFERALELDPENATLLNNLAWVLATSPDDELRNGKRAIELATKACELTDYKAAHILSTLAAGYAETGDFESARKWSQAAVDINDPDHLEQLKEELASYRENRPWRERQTLEDLLNEAAGGPADEDEAAGEEPDESADEESDAESADGPATAEVPATADDR